MVLQPYVGELDNICFHCDQDVSYDARTALIGIPSYVKGTGGPALNRCLPSRLCLRIA